MISRSSDQTVRENVAPLLVCKVLRYVHNILPCLATISMLTSPLPTVAAGARPYRELLQSQGICSASASATAIATDDGTATSNAQAQAICNALSSGSGVAEAISSAVAAGNSEAVAQAIAEAASGGENNTSYCLINVAPSFIALCALHCS